MPQRLDLLGGRQVMNLTSDDAPLVARAIVACMLRLARIGSCYVNNVAMVHMTGAGFNLYVRGEDWLKLAPYLLDGTFPASDGVSRDPAVREADVDTNDGDLYGRVLGLLLALFPTRYPRSNL